MGTTYRGAKGSKLTITEGDDSREWSSEAGTKATGSDLTFDRSGGWFHATSASPETGVLTIDEAIGISKSGVAGARPGTWVMFYWSGAINPTFTGQSGTITPYNTITTAGTYECWLVHKGSGNYSLSIPQAGSGAGDTSPPTVLTMTVEDANPNDLVVTLNSLCTFTNIGVVFRVNTVARTLTSVSGSGTAVATYLISGAAIVDTDVLDFAYDSTTGDIIKASNSVELVTFTASSVTNNIATTVTPIYQSDFATINDFTLLNASDSMAVVGGDLVLTNPSGLSQIGISLTTSNFDAPDNVNFQVGETYRLEVDISAFDAKYTRYQWIYPTTPAPPAEQVMTTGTFTDSRTGMTSGSMQLAFNKAVADPVAFAGETVTISEIRVYKE